MAYASTTCAETLLATVADADGRPLADAVVIAEPKGGTAPAASPSRETIDQVDKEFIPYVKPLRVGTPVKFPNNDDIRHHVYSFSSAKTFELQLYRGTPAEPVVFDRKGIVKLGCNIHDWMLAYVYVTDAPYFGTTGPDGRVELKGLVAGAYKVRVWHPRMKLAETDTARDIEFRGEESLAWKLDLNPEYRPPRVSGPGGNEYR